VLSKLDISGNKTDISIINALRSVLETKSSLKSLSISNLHKINPKSQDIIINAFTKNKNLKNIDLKKTTEVFYYTLREKLQEREEGPAVKISFTKFVHDRGSDEKDEKDEKDENVNEINTFEKKANEYSARVRIINRENIFNRKSSKSSTKNSGKSSGNNLGKSPGNNLGKSSAKNSKEPLSINTLKTESSKPQTTEQEESEVSDITDNMITTYHKTRNMHSIDSGNEDHKNNSLQYSMSNLECENLESENSDTSS
jgi:hypothetical protein